MRGAKSWGARPVHDEPAIGAGPASGFVPSELEQLPREHSGLDDELGRVLETFAERVQPARGCPERDDEIETRRDGRNVWHQAAPWR